MRQTTCFYASLTACILLAFVGRAASPKVDRVLQDQAAAESKSLADNSPRTQTAAILEYRKTVAHFEYPSGKLKLPCWIYWTAGNGPFPVMIWNHGSEKNPLSQAELARFYTDHGFLFCAPIREGHGNAPGDYILDLQKQILARGINDQSLAQAVALHDRFNKNVVDAVAWVKAQPFVDHNRIFMSGVSFGGIQTLLTAEKGLGIRGFIPFAPGAMSWAIQPLQQRLVRAAKNAKAPVFLLQAKNDYSTGPSERLGPILKTLGPPSGNKLFPPFGSSHQQGHGAFACWALGTTLWGDDVLHFLAAAEKVDSNK